MADAATGSITHTPTQGAAAEGISGASGSVQGVVQAAPGVSEAVQGAAAPGAGEALGHTAQAAQTAAQTAASLPLESTFTWSGYFQAIGVLLLLLAALWGLVWAIRKYGKFNFLPQAGALPRDALRLEAQLPLGPRRSLMVVRFLNKRLLLGVTDHQITLLQETGYHHEQNGFDFQNIMEEAQRRKPDV